MWPQKLSCTQLAISSVFVATFCFQSANAEDFLSQADSAYQAGDCKNAVGLYQKVIETPALDPQSINNALFKQSYCYLNLGNNDAAGAGFYRYLKSDSTNLEARALFTGVDST